MGIHGFFFCIRIVFNIFSPELQIIIQIILLTISFLDSLICQLLLIFLLLFFRSLPFQIGKLLLCLEELLL